MNTQTTSQFPPVPAVSRNPINNFLYWLTSTDLNIISMCPLGERRHRMALGMVMLIPMILGFEAGYYAGGILSDGNHLVSLLLGATICTMVTFMEKSVTAGLSGTKITAAVRVRIGLGLIWAALLSPIVAISWFSDAIDARVFKKEQKIKTDINAKYDRKKAEQVDRLVPAASSVERTRLDMVQEADGTGGSGYRDMGPIYKMKENVYHAQQAEYATLKTEVDRNVVDIETARASDLRICSSEVAKGLLGRVNTLFEVAGDNWYISFQLLCTFLFLFSVEIIAIMAKLDYNSKEANIYNVLVKSTSEEILTGNRMLQNARQEIALFPTILERQRQGHVHELERFREQSAQDVELARLQGEKLLALAKGQASFEVQARAVAGDDANLYQRLCGLYRGTSGMSPEAASTNDFGYTGPIVQEWEENLETPFAVSQPMIDTCREIYTHLPANATDTDKAQALYEWIHSNITYSKDVSNGQLTALECFNNRSGVCIAMSCLFVAMAKVIGISTPTVVNIDVDTQGEVVEHACAGYWNGLRQVLVDCAYHTFDVNHQLFHNWSESRVKEYFESIRVNLAA